MNRCLWQWFERGGTKDCQYISKGKLNLYVNAVNELMKSESDNTTIGLLICKDKDQTEVQWAFQGIETPIRIIT